VSRAMQDAAQLENEMVSLEVECRWMTLLMAAETEIGFREMQDMVKDLSGCCALYAVGCFVNEGCPADGSATGRSPQIGVSEIRRCHTGSPGERRHPVQSRPTATRPISVTADTSWLKNPSAPPHLVEGAEQLASRCETVLNVTLAEMGELHVRIDEVEGVVQRWLEGEMRMHEGVIKRLRGAWGPGPAASGVEGDMLGTEGKGALAHVSDDLH
jgi:hypothetical protein